MDDPSVQNRGRTGPRLGRFVAAWSALLLPLVVVGFLAHHTLSDLDIWLHWRAGEQILAGEGVPDRNGYSFTATDERWVDHEWLFQVLVAGVARSAASAEPVAVANRWNGLRILLAVAIVALLLRGARGYARTESTSGRGWQRSILLIPVVTAALALLWPRLIIRPELLSYGLLLLIIPRIERALGLHPYTAGPTLGAGRELFLPAHPAGQTFWLTLLWAQLHGFYALVAAVWVLGLISSVPRRGRIAQRRPAARSLPPDGTPAAVPIRLVLTASGLALAAGLFTPAGFDGLVYPLRALAQLGDGGVDLRRTIGEMAPLGRTFGALATTITVFRWSILWSVIWIILTWGRIGWLRLLLVAIAAWAAWSSQRAIGFYALAFVLMHSGYGGVGRMWWQKFERCNRWADRARSPLVVRAGHAAALGGSAVVAIVWLNALVSNSFYLGEGVVRRFGGGLTPAHYPVALAEELARESTNPPPRIVNNLDAAGYLVGRRVGQVYIDGRTEAYPPALWREYRRLLAGGDTAVGILRDRRAEHICLASGSGAVQPLLRTVLVAPGWHLTAVDESGVLLKAGSPTPGDATAAELLTAARDRLLAELPGPAQNYDGAGGRTGAADRCAALANLLGVAGRPDDAALLLRRGLRYAPDHGLLNDNLGNLLLDRGEYATAADRFARAARGNRRAVEPRINLAVCYVHLGRLSAAEEALSAALAIDPQRGAAWANMAEVRRRRGNRPGALAAYDRALALLPHDRNLRARASAYRAGSR